MKTNIVGIIIALILRLWEQFILHRVTLILSRLKVRRST